MFRILLFLTVYVRTIHTFIKLRFKGKYFLHVKSYADSKLFRVKNKSKGDEKGYARSVNPSGFFLSK